MFNSSGGGINLNKITIVIPTLNEAPGIGPTIKEYQGTFPRAHTLVVDGRSTDGTQKIAHSLGAEVIQQEGKGKGKAIETAIKHIKNNGYTPNYIIFTDGDYTYPAKPVLKMIKILEKYPKVGMVTGNRFHTYKQNGNQKDVFNLGNLLLKFLHICLNKIWMKDPLTGLRVLKWTLIKNWKPQAKHFGIEVEMNNYISKQAKIIEIPIRYRQRLGTKKLRLRHGLSIALQIIKNIRISIKNRSLKSENKN